ncbi:heavy-metal-associated domain-containing protein [Natronogracilivirga saccharolytica]|uniref:Heavy-metal-associated domain-containing protein n=1 Tax=Natronogracilivirga saccharolytica TaxID=2812953 RepID=A0A8J7RIU2_9BACT|nr:heavy-metal-associated domain-containing protein [Natronogracilivirga saccharolytica]MBP3192067.1 heavy-metal-associated domain-containing protein [Natronogracilivirga saccharolytica]
MEKKEVFKVEGMSCSGCSGTVETALSQDDGVTLARVSHEDGTAEVHHTLTDREIIDIITGAGYTVTEKISG